MKIGMTVKLIPEMFTQSWTSRLNKSAVYRIVEVDESDHSLLIEDLANGIKCWVTMASCNPISVDPVEIDGVKYSYESGLITFVENNWMLKTSPLLTEINGVFVLKTDPNLFEYEGKYYFKKEAIRHNGMLFPKSCKEVVEYCGNFYHISKVISAKSFGGKKLLVPKTEVVVVDGENYDVNYISEYGYRKAYETNQYVLETSLYRWEDGTYRLTREGNKVYSYHSMSRIWDAGENAKFTIGFEIEKNKKPPFTFYREDLLDRNFIIEYDGSVPEGFELVTPTYDLFDKTVESKLEYIKEFCNVSDVTNCGGHIHFGVKGFSGVDTLKRLKGWLPLIYAMYRGRATNDYSFAKKTDKLISDGDRRQSVRLLTKHIEFRIVAAVYNYDTLIWRLGFMRILANNIDLTFEQVLLLALNKRSVLSKHLLMTYKSKESLFKMLEAAVKFHTDLEGADLKSVDKALKRMTTYKYKKSSAKSVVN